MVCIVPGSVGLGRKPALRRVVDSSLAETKILVGAVLLYHKKERPAMTTAVRNIIEYPLIDGNGQWYGGQSDRTKELSSIINKQEQEHYYWRRRVLCSRQKLRTTVL